MRVLLYLYVVSKASGMSQTCLLPQPKADTFFKSSPLLKQRKSGSWCWFEAALPVFAEAERDAVQTHLLQGRAGEEAQLSGMRQEQELQNRASAEVSWNCVTVLVKLAGRGEVGLAPLAPQPRGCDSAICRTGTVCVSPQIFSLYSYGSCCQSLLQKHKADTQSDAGERLFPGRVLLLSRCSEQVLAQGLPDWFSAPARAESVDR